MYKPKSKLVGKIVEIINKEHWLYEGYGVILHYDGRHYHIAPWTFDTKPIKTELTLVFQRDEFKIKRNLNNKI